MTHREPAEAHAVTDGPALARLLRAWVDAMAQAAALVDRVDRAQGTDDRAGTCALITLRQAADAVRALPATADAVWVVDQAARSVLENGLGRAGVVLTLLLGAARERTDTATLTPVALARILRAMGQALTECGVGDSDARSLDLLGQAILDDVEWEASELDAPGLAAAAWIAAQGALVEDGDKSAGLAAVVLVLLAATYDALDPEARALATSMSMLAALTPDRARAPRSADLRIDFHVTGDSQALSDCRSHAGPSDRGIVAGIPDDLGFYGTYAVSMLSARPFAVLPALARSAHVYTPHPLDLVDPVGQNSTVLTFERRPQQRQMVVPAVIACTPSRGIVEELARLGAYVIWGEGRGQSELEAVIARTRADVVVIAASTPKREAEARQARRALAAAGIDVIVAPTGDDLQVLHVASACTGRVGGHLDAEDLARLQRSRVMETLESIHTVALDQTISLADVVSADDASVQVLLGADGAARGEVVAALEAISPWLRVDIIQGDQPGPTIVGIAKS